MAKVRFKTNIAGHYDVRRRSPLVGLLEAEGKRIMDGANSTLPEGEGYKMSSAQGRKGPSPTGRGRGFQGRWAVRVYTATNHAKRSNAVNNTLVNLLGRA